MVFIYVLCLPRRPLEEKSYKSAAGQTAAAGGGGGPGLVSRVWPGLLLHQGNWGLAHLYTGDSRCHVLSWAVMCCHVLS